MGNEDADVESGSLAGKGPGSVSMLKIVFDHALITPEVANWKYEGGGTEDDPYVRAYLWTIHFFLTDNFLGRQLD